MIEIMQCNESILSLKDEDFTEDSYLALLDIMNKLGFQLIQWRIMKYMREVPTEEYCGCTRDAFREECRDIIFCDENDPMGRVTGEFLLIKK